MSISEVELGLPISTVGEVPDLSLKWRLRMAADQAGMTQADLGEAVGVNWRTISRWFTGQHEPNKGQLIACAMVTGVPYIWLAHGINPHTEKAVSDFANDLDQYTARDSNPEPAD